jgi:hypothetical protein
VKPGLLFLLFSLFLGFASTGWAWTEHVLFMGSINIPEDSQEIYFQNGGVSHMGEGPYHSVTISADPNSPRILDVDITRRTPTEISMGTPGWVNSEPVKAFVDTLRCFPAKGAVLDINLANEIIHQAIPQLYPAIYNWAKN